MPLTLVPLLVFFSVLAIGGAVLIAQRARKQTVTSRLQNSSGSIEEGLPTGRLRWLGLIGRVGAAVSYGKVSSYLRAELAAAGFHHRNAGFVYLGAKMLLLMIGLTGLTILLLPVGRLALPPKMLLIIFGSYVLFTIPNLIVSRQRFRRSAEIQRHLADALDLLEVCVSAGMGIDSAWNWVEEEMRTVSPTLADEMALCTLEMHLGESRGVAMRHMADRTRVHDVHSLVGVLAQSERFGTSISDALQTFASAMRETRSMRAEEAAEKMPLKMLFPLILLVFPALLIVICGPSALKWVEIMGG